MSKKNTSDNVKLSTRFWPYFYKIMIQLLTFTCKVNIYGYEYLDELKKQKKTWIFSVWHNNVPISPWALRKEQFSAMISDSRDGEIIARCLAVFGNTALRGSSSKNAARATRQALKHLRQGKTILITPDGPRGPKYELQDGVLWLAAAGKVDIIGFHIECSRQWEFNSWDGQKLPKPFSTINLCYTSPVQVNKQMLETQFESTRSMLHKHMMDNVSYALEKAGRSETNS